MNTKLQHGRDFEIINWDWRAECPWEECVELGRKYKYYRRVSCGDDHVHVLFSNTEIESDEKATDIANGYYFSIAEEI